MYVTNEDVDVNVIRETDIFLLLNFSLLMMMMMVMQSLGLGEGGLFTCSCR